MTGDDTFLASDAVTADGSPVRLYVRLPPGDEPSIIDAAIPPGSDILELGAGAGRVTHALLSLGHRVVAVDDSPDMLAHIHGAERVLGTIETLDLDRRFPVVLLASRLVNTADDAQRRAFLAGCRRHVSDDGFVLIERHDPDWVNNARETVSERAGVRIAVTDVKREPPLVSAVMVYDVDGERYRQPFTARVLDDEALAEELRQSGLRVVRYLTRTWVLAEPHPRTNL